MRAGVLPAFVGACGLLGLDWRRLLAAGELDADLLSQPEARIPAVNVAQLLRLGVETSGRRDFPFVVAQAFEPEMMGPPILWAMRQATVADGLAIYEDRLKTRNNSLLIKTDRIGTSVLFQPVILDPGLRSDSLDVDLVMGLCLRLLRWLIGEGWWPKAAYFSYPRPADISAHRRLFGEVEFGHAQCGLLIDERWLDQPIEAPDEGVMAVLKHYADANARNNGASAVEVMCELIARMLPTGQCGIDLAAQRQGVDRRTVHRRLAAEGCSFTDLVERVRRELIAEEIGDESHSLTAISEILGFSSLSTFSRWHRQAFGAAARDVRRSGAKLARPAEGRTHAP